MQTAEKLISTEPLVSFASVVAARFTLVLADPLHILYTKVNEFLNKSPTWNLDKLPSYWIAKIFFLPSDHAEAHHHEVEWLLEALLQGLRNLSVSWFLMYDLGTIPNFQCFRIWIYIGATLSSSASCLQPCLHEPLVHILKKSSKCYTVARWLEARQL